MADNTTGNNINRGFIGVSGIFTTRRKYDMSDEIIFRDRVVAKFLNMLSRRMQKMKVKDPEPKILDFVPESNVFGISNNAGTGTAFHISDVYGQQLQAGDILSVNPATVDGTVQSSLEVVRVVDVGASGSAGAGLTLVTVQRDYANTGSTVDISTAANFNLVWLGNSVKDGGGSGVPIWKEPGAVQNYIQTFSKDIGETRLENRTDVYGKISMSTKARLKRELFLEEINWALLLSQLGKRWEDGAAIRTTRGVVPTIPSGNIVSMANKMGVPEFLSEMEQTFFAQGNKRREKLLLCGGGFKLQIDSMPWSEAIYRRNAELSQITGFNINTIEAGSGRLHVLVEDAFRGTGFYNAALVLDLDYLGYMFIDDIQIVKNTEPNEARWNRTQWTMYGDIGLFMVFNEAHFLLHSPSAPV